MKKYYKVGPVVVWGPITVSYTNPISSMFFSPIFSYNPYRLLTASKEGKDGVAHLYDFQLGEPELICTFKCHDKPLAFAVFDLSTYGREIITCSEDITKKRWNISTGECHELSPEDDCLKLNKLWNILFPPNDNNLLTLAYKPDGKSKTTTDLWKIIDGDYYKLEVAGDSLHFNHHTIIVIRKNEFDIVWLNTTFELTLNRRESDWWFLSNENGILFVIEKGIDFACYQKPFFAIAYRGKIKIWAIEAIRPFPMETRININRDVGEDD